MTKITNTKLFGRAIFRNKFFMSNKVEGMPVRDKVITGFMPAMPHEAYRTSKSRNNYRKPKLVRDVAPFKEVFKAFVTKSRAGVEYTKYVPEIVNN